LDTSGYLLFSMEGIKAPETKFWSDRASRDITLMGRLRSGISLEQAQASVDVVARRLGQQYPANNKDITVRVYPEAHARPQPDPEDSTPMVVGLFMGLAALVTILACINVANILLVRATVRQREVTVRAALGAARRRLVQQLLTESILLAMLGGAAGVLLGWGASIGLGSIRFPIPLPLYFDFSFDWRVFLYALSAALLTGLIIGVVPALRASCTDLNSALHEAGRSIISSRHRLRSALVISQVAGSLVLLVVAGLFMRSLRNAVHVNLGFDPTHVDVLTMEPHEVGYSKAQARQFFQELLLRTRAMSGVESAALAFSVPMGYYSDSETVRIEGRTSAPGEHPTNVGLNRISPDYFETLRIAVLRGRDFSEADDENARRVAIINESMATRFWPDANAIGKRFKLDSDPSPWIQVVGVVADGKYSSIRDHHLPYFYVPLAQDYATIQTLHVRALLPPEIVIPQLEREIRRLAPDLPLFDVHPMSKSLESFNGLFLYRVGAGLASALGMLGLVLALVGVYGVVSYIASQRTREISIRMALGAQPRDVLKMVLHSGLVPVGLGVLLGVLAVSVVARVLSSLLVGVSAEDPLTFIGITLMLAAATLFACYIPARRAMHVDPMVALRYE
jgi:predicted permease